MLLNYLVFIVTLILIKESRQLSVIRHENECIISGKLYRMTKIVLSPCQKNHNADAKTVILNNCEINTIDTDSFEDYNLTKITLENNHLTEFGDWLTCLTNLEIISLTNNKICILKNNALIHQKHLGLFVLNYNSLSKIEEDAFAGNLNKLVIVDLSHNKLTSVGYEFQRLSKLYNIDLSHNEIESIAPEAFTENKNLEEIYLNNNNLKQLPDDFYLKCALGGLFLSNNKLVSTEALTQSTALDILDLSGNNLLNLKLSNMDEIQVLYLHNNRLHYADVIDFIKSHKTLKYISISDNQMGCKALHTLSDTLEWANISIYHKYETFIKAKDIVCEVPIITNNKKIATTQRTFPLR